MEDAKIVGKSVCFWNWKQESLHVMLRQNKSNIELFKSCDNVDDLVEGLPMMNGKTETVLSFIEEK